MAQTEQAVGAEQVDLGSKLRTRPPKNLYAQTVPDEIDKFDKFDEYDLKYRIRENKATPENIRQQIRELRQDIERTRNFWVEIEDDSVTWRVLTLQSIVDELESFQSLADEWLAVADAGLVNEHVGSELHEPTKPLFQGIEDLETEDEYQEFQIRERALMAVLDNEGLLDIFRYVAENPGGGTGEPLPNRKKQDSDNGWRWWAKRYLMTEYGLIEDASVFSNRPSYMMTNRGEVLYETVKRLFKSEIVKQQAERDNLSKARAAARAIKI
ncbi:MAG: hypothetical protein V5A40_13385 [Haloarculaceae archaeon]